MKGQHYLIIDEISALRSGIRLERPAWADENPQEYADFVASLNKKNLSYLLPGAAVIRLARELDYSDMSDDTRRDEEQPGW